MRPRRKPKNYAECAIDHQWFAQRHAETARDEDYHVTDRIEAQLASAKFAAEARRLADHARKVAQLSQPLAIR